MVSGRLRILHAAFDAALACALLGGSPASGQSADLPPYLQDYYAPILAVFGPPMAFMGQQERNGVEDTSTGPGIATPAS